MGCFPVRSCISNQYIMLAYHCECNVFLVKPFQTKQNHHRIYAYSRIITRLKNRVQTIEHQVLKNDVSNEFFRVIEEDWKVEYQLVTLTSTAAALPNNPSTL